MLGDTPNIKSVHTGDEDAVTVSLREFRDHLSSMGQLTLVAPQTFIRQFS